MRFVNTNLNYKRKKKGKVVKVISKNGSCKKIRLYKNIPKGCRVAKRICIKCLINSIHKLESNYYLKICKTCLMKEFSK